jgi:tetratricopeptide (TPR) repeat protein
MRKTTLALVAVIVAAGLLLACGGPEEKKGKFFGKAKELFERGDLVRARLEVKNALQIDPKFAEAYGLLGRIEMQAGDFRAAYGALEKAVELNPGLLAAQLELGKLLLVSGQPDKAMEKAELALAKDAADPEGLMLKGSTLLARREFEATARVFEGLLQKSSSPWS